MKLPLPARNVRAAIIAAGVFALAGCRPGGDSTSDLPSTGAEAPRPGVGSPAAGAPPSAARPTATPLAPPPETPGQAAHADDDSHAHLAPHGGSIVTAGSGHLEAVAGDGTLRIYVLDASEATMPVESVAGWEALLELPGSSRALALRPMGDHLVATIPDGVGGYTAAVTVHMGGEARTARFGVSADGRVTPDG